MFFCCCCWNDPHTDYRHSKCGYNFKKCFNFNLLTHTFNNTVLEQHLYTVYQTHILVSKPQLQQQQFSNNLVIITTLVTTIWCPSWNGSRIHRRPWRSLKCELGQEYGVTYHNVKNVKLKVKCGFLHVKWYVKRDLRTQKKVISHFTGWI